MAKRRHLHYFGAKLFNLGHEKQSEKLVLRLITSNFLLNTKIYKYKLESFGRIPLCQQGPFSGVSLSGEQKKSTQIL